VCPYDTIRTDGRLTLLGFMAPGCCWRRRPAGADARRRRTDRGFHRTSPVAAAPRTAPPAAPRARAEIDPLATVQLFLAGHAAMPETGFAKALYYQVAGDAEAGSEAVRWALGEATILRQEALVYDWCQDLLTRRRSANWSHACRVASPPPRPTMPFAAVRRGPWRRWRSSITCRRFPARNWIAWCAAGGAGRWSPTLAAGRSAVAREDAYALYELLHVLRDNTNVDLRESAKPFFRAFPIGTSGELLSGAHGSSGERFLHRRRAAHRRARPATWRRSPAQPNWPWSPTTRMLRTRNFCKAG
jgi:hypothetical protein